MFLNYNKWQHYDSMLPFLDQLNVNDKDAICIIVLHKQRIIAYFERIDNTFHPYHCTFHISCLEPINQPAIYDNCVKTLCQFNDTVKLSFVTCHNKILADVLLKNHFKKKRQCFEDDIVLNTLI